jgi:hypothetical protein
MLGRIAALRLPAESFSAPQWAGSAHGNPAIEEKIRRAITSVEAEGHSARKHSGFSPAKVVQSIHSLH